MLEQKDKESLINQPLIELPEHYKSVLLLKEVEQLSHSDIAKIMGKTVVSTKVILFRAKQKYKENFARLGGEA